MENYLFLKMSQNTASTSLRPTSAESKLTRKAERQRMSRKREQLPACLPGPPYRGNTGVRVTNWPGAVTFSNCTRGTATITYFKKQPSAFERVVLFMLCRQTSKKAFGSYATYLLITPEQRWGEPYKK